MNKKHDFGQCDLCDSELSAHYHSLDYLIERLNYHCPDDPDNVLATADILYADSLHCYCGPACAAIGAQAELAERGVSLLYPGGGPLEPCAKCGALVELSQPYVEYQLMELTEHRELSPVTLQPYAVETLAIVCLACDGEARRHLARAEPETSNSPLLERSTTGHDSSP